MPLETILSLSASEYCSSPVDWSKVANDVHFLLPLLAVEELLLCSDYVDGEVDEFDDDDEEDDCGWEIRLRYNAVCRDRKVPV